MNSNLEEKREVAHPSGWQTFEVIFGIPFLIAVGLQFVVPLSLPREIPAPAFILAGILFIIAGLVLIVFARREFAQKEQPTEPGRPTSELVTTGVFSISRNPLYLGGICFIMGIGLAFELAWVLIFLIPAIIACYYILIAPEEQYLAKKFGSKYHSYAGTVHRWIGRTKK